MPKVSVIMGVHNGSLTIKRAVDSILNQTLTDIEFIICDDNSTDDTLQILNEYSQRDARVKIIHSDKNIGLSAGLNKCIELAESGYLARMDDDDFSHEDRLEKQLAFAESHPQYAIVGCSRRTFDKEGFWEIYDKSGELTKYDIISGNIFTHPTVMLKTADVKRVGGYTVSPRTMRGQDYDMWCKMYSADCRGYVMPDVLFDYFEDRNKIKEVKWKSRWYNFRTHMIWRKKMGLSMKYDIYAYKELLAMVLPHSILVKYKKAKRSQ